MELIMCYSRFLPVVGQTISTPGNVWLNKKNYTLPETNIAPENVPSQKEIYLPTIESLGFRGHVSFREGRSVFCFCNFDLWLAFSLFATGLGGVRRLHGKKWQKPSQVFLGSFLVSFVSFWLCVCVFSCLFVCVSLFGGLLDCLLGWGT